MDSNGLPDESQNYSVFNYPSSPFIPQSFENNDFENSTNNIENLTRNRRLSEFNNFNEFNEFNEGNISLFPFNSDLTYEAVTNFPPIAPQLGVNTSLQPNTCSETNSLEDFSYLQSTKQEEIFNQNQNFDQPPNFNQISSKSKKIAKPTKPRKEAKYNCQAMSIMLKYLELNKSQLNAYKDMNELPKVEYHKITVSRNRTFTSSMSRDAVLNYLQDIAWFVLNFDLSMLKKSHKNDVNAFTIEKKLKIFYFCVGYNESNVKTKCSFAKHVNSAWENALKNMESKQNQTH